MGRNILLLLYQLNPMSKQTSKSKVEKKQGGFIGVVFVIVMGLILFILIGALGTDFYKTMKYSVGWVWVERKGTAVKEFIKEEDSCVYFIDVWDKEVKTCGIYQIEKLTK